MIEILKKLLIGKFIRCTCVTMYTSWNAALNARSTVAEIKKGDYLLIVNINLCKNQIDSEFFEYVLLTPYGKIMKLYPFKDGSFKDFILVN